MPYIAPKDRAKLDPLIDQLAERIVEEVKEYKYDGAFAGLLNYTATRLALKIVRLQFGKMRYWIIAAVRHFQQRSRRVLPPRGPSL